MQKQIQNEEQNTLESREAERILRPALQVEGVEKNFFHLGEGRFALKDISFTLERGYILGLIGRNGAGKSTLLRILLQSIPRKRGRILIGGYDVATHATEAKKLVGYVGEDFHFLSKETLRENGRVFGMFYPEFDMERYLELLARFELGADKPAGQLSKGETTKAQLAFALAHKPELLLLDEPTGGLDPVVRREFLYVLQSELMDERMSIIFSTHITEDLDKVADYVAMMEKGRLLFFETKDELLEHLAGENGERLTLKQLMVKLCREGEKK
ncbi:MAG: ABC transporter ATP-binding protein [Lachnospiraceae bacterium]|nr:ABC transporter ATP-binding protein [Lachnospiraceae bacterium]